MPRKKARKKKSRKAVRRSSQGPDRGLFYVAAIAICAILIMVFFYDYAVKQANQQIIEQILLDDDSFSNEDLIKDLGELDTSDTMIKDEGSVPVVAKIEAPGKCRQNPTINPATEGRCAYEGSLSKAVCLNDPNCVFE